MYDLLRELALQNEWVFEYSRKDYQNLYDEMTTDKVHLFVDPITIDSTFTDSGNETKSYSGKLMLLMSSDVDEGYGEKFKSYIRPLMTGALLLLKDELACSEFTINRFQSIEVINLFDFNLDGLLITYSISDNQ